MEIQGRWRMRGSCKVRIADLDEEIYSPTKSGAHMQFPLCLAGRLLDHWQLSLLILHLLYSAKVGRSLCRVIRTAAWHQMCLAFKYFYFSSFFCTFFSPIFFSPSFWSTSVESLRNVFYHITTLQLECADDLLWLWVFIWLHCSTVLILHCKVQVYVSWCANFPGQPLQSSRSIIIWNTALLRVYWVS